MRECQADGRKPTGSEQRELSAWSGWGGASKVFDERGGDDSEWGRARARLKELLSETEYETARHSMLTAFYTPDAVCRTMVGVLKDAGFGEPGSGDTCLEPGCGAGNMMVAARAARADLDFTGIELDGISAGVAAGINPDAEIVNRDFAECIIPELAYATAIGNVPYSDAVKIRDHSTGRNLPIHDWTIKNSIEALRPGGVAVLLTSTFTMDKKDSSAREEIASMADLAGAVRLPSTTFRKQAGTEVLSDLLVFRRREAPRAEGEPMPDWTQTMEIAGGARCNRWIFEHSAEGVSSPTPLKTVSGRFGPAVGMDDEPETPEEISRAIAGCLGVQRERAHELGLAAISRDTLGPASQECTITAVPSRFDTYAYALAGDGSIWYGSAAGIEPVEGLKPSEEARLRAMIEIRDLRRELVEIENSVEDDASCDEARTRLKDHTDAFHEAYGAISGAYNRRVWRTRDDNSYSALCSLEILDADGKLVGDADMLRERTHWPKPPLPTSADTPAQALSISLNAHGCVDMPYIAELLGLKDKNEAREALGESVERDPVTGRWVTADRFLSGNLGERIDAINAQLNELTTEHDRPYIEQAVADADPFRQESRARAAGNARASLLDVLERYGQLEAVATPSKASRPANMSGLKKDHIGPWEADAVHTLPELARALDPDCDATSIRYLLNVCGCTRSQGYEGPGDIADMLRSLTEIALDPACDAFPQDTFTSLARAALESVRYAVERDIRQVCLERREYPASCKAASIEATALGIAGSDALAALLDDGTSDDATKARDAAGRELRADPAPLLSAAIAIDRAAAWYGADGVVPSQVMQLGPFLEDDPHAAQERCRDIRDRIDAARRTADATRDTDAAAELIAQRGRLEDALPKPLAMGEFTCQFGAPWIPPKFIADFLEDGLCEYGRDFGTEVEKLDISFDADRGTWDIKGSSRAYGLRTTQEFTFGTIRVNQIVQAALNNTKVTAFKTDLATGKRAEDGDAQQAVDEAVTKVKTRWAKWAASDPDRSAELAGIYNRIYNRTVPNRVDGSYLDFPDMSSAVTLRKHQADCIARIMQSDTGTLVGHVVGAGKTFTGIAAAHEAKRCGRCMKPLVVVPNSLVLQWASDWATLYPIDRILYMEDGISGEENVRRFWERASTGNWDAVLVPYSRFEKVDVSIERQVESMRGRISELMAEYEGKVSEKALEKMRTQLTDEIKKLNESPSPAANFEELGCDMLVLDEAHNYKNLKIATPMDIAGITNASSKKCEKMLRICDYMRERGLGANIVFETGTPISNNMSELYNMQRYLAPEKLEQYRVQSFTGWANTFGEPTTALELKPETGGFRTMTRFNRFRNLTELRAITGEYADLVTSDQLGIKLPELKSRLVAVKPSESQSEEIAALGPRADQIRSGHVPPNVDNMLKITSEGRLLALDPKLLPMHADDAPLPRGKVQACVDKAVEIWEQTADIKGTQLIFCDSNTDADKSKGFNVYDDLIERFAAAGVPADQVHSIGEAGGNKEKRQKLFDRVSAGEVRILIGSTDKLGTGVNVQQRLVATHDLDCPWKPAQLEQRLGRMVRQGNMNETVQNIRYVTMDTFDAYMYQTCESKQGFIDQFFKGGGSLADADLGNENESGEMEVDFATIKAVATGSPVIKEMCTLETEAKKLEAGAKVAQRRREEAKVNLVSRRERLCALEGYKEGKWSPERGATAKAALDRLEELSKSDKPEAGKKVDTAPLEIMDAAAAAADGEVTACAKLGPYDVITVGVARASLSTRIAIGIDVDGMRFWSAKSLEMRGAGFVANQLKEELRQTVTGAAEIDGKIAKVKEDIELYERVAEGKEDPGTRLKEVKGRIAQIKELYNLNTGKLKPGAVDPNPPAAATGLEGAENIEYYGSDDDIRPDAGGAVAVKRDAAADGTDAGTGTPPRAEQPKEEVIQMPIFADGTDTVTADLYRSDGGTGEEEQPKASSQYGSDGDMGTAAI